jgi:hypothetical protein
VLSALCGDKNVAAVGVACMDEGCVLYDGCVLSELAPANKGMLDVVEGAIDIDICSALEASVNDCDELCALGFADPVIRFF